jgi:hypothetical protein
VTDFEVKALGARPWDILRGARGACPALVDLIVD